MPGSLPNHCRCSPDEAGGPQKVTAGASIRAIEALRQAIRAWDGPPSLADEAVIPFDIASLDAVLGGGISRGALHEIAAPHEPDLAPAAGFTLALAARACAGESRSAASLATRSGPDTGLPIGARNPRKAALWVAEDMGLIENGAPYGPGLDAFGLAPEQLVLVAAAKSREVLWAMEEAVRCGAVGAVIGEVRGDCIDLVASRRLSLAAADSRALALLLRTLPPEQASAAATRWIVGAVPSHAPHGSGPRERGPSERGLHERGPPRFAVALARNRRGPLGSWMLEFGRDQRFLLASADPEPVARPLGDRPHRAAGATGAA